MDGLDWIFFQKARLKDVDMLHTDQYVFSFASEKFDIQQLNCFLHPRPKRRVEDEVGFEAEEAEVSE